jgi:kumamolisin
MRPPPSARLLGSVNEGERLNVTIVLRRRPAGPSVPGPAHYLHTPPAERPRLSEADFAARYGADPTEIERVADFTRSHGLTVDETNAARRTVVVSGTVGEFNTAFNVSLQNYEHEVERSPRTGKQTERYHGYDGVIHVPGDLVEVIVGVFGLDNRRITKRGLADPPATTLLTMPTVRLLYNFPPNLAAGQTIAIFSEAGYLASDIAANFGGSPPPLVDIAVDAPNGGFPDFETTQDIFIAASAAPGAQIAIYFTTYDQKGWVDLIARVIHPNLTLGDPQCSVLSSSFYARTGMTRPRFLPRGFP